MPRSIDITKSKEGVSFSRPLASILATLPFGTYTLSVARKRKKRTLPQNALMWLWFTCISRESGMPIQDVHDTYCARFLARDAATLQGDIVRVYGSTSRLSTEAMATFLDQVQADAAEMGIILPRPEDLYFDDFYNEYKNYL